MKSSSAGFRLALGLCAALLCAGGAGAQGNDVPPAFGVAQRLHSEAVAARHYAAVLDGVKDTGDASYQREIAHRRAYQAVQKYQEVVNSATYRHSPSAAEALFNEAQLHENFLNDKYAASQNYQTLENNFSDVQYADKGRVTAEKIRVENEIDHENKTTGYGKYLYAVIDFFVGLTGHRAYSYALAIFLIALLFRVIVTPLSNKQYASMKEMQKLQPYLQEINAKYKNDMETRMKKVQEVYKEHSVNPYAGCLPLLIQLPIMSLLYYMIRLYQYQFAHGTFVWIGSPLSHLYPSFLGLSLGQQDIPLLLLYALSMYISQKMTIMPSPDPQQAEQQKMMAVMTPFMSTYFFLQWHLPSAFVLYYLIFNILSTGQQMYYMKKRAAAATDTGDAGEGGDGGSKTKLPPLPTPPGNGAEKNKGRSTGTNGNDRPAVTRRPPGRDVPLAEAKGQSEALANGANANGAAPTAKGIMAPKVHPKKKRR